jgi:autotransporter-associated beta strand protein
MNITQILKTTKRIFGFSRVLPALAGLALLIPSTAQAANGTWSTLSSGNASGSWGTQGNWSGLTLPTTSGDTANFGTLNITSDSTVTLDGNQSVNALIFGDSAISTAANWILSSGAPGTYTLTLGGTTPSITVNPLGSTKTATISAIVNGTTGLIKAGSGPLTLSNANTYTGTTTLNSGTLRITGSLNGTTGTPLTFSGSGTFNSSEASGISQSMGALTLSAGDGTVQSTFGSGSAIALTFDSLATRVKGASANFVVSGGVNGTDNKIVFTSAPTAGQLVDRGFFFGGSSYAAYDAGGYMRGLVYGTDANTVASLSGTLATLGINDATQDVQFAGSAKATTTSGSASSNTKTLPVTDGTKFSVGQAITGSGIPANTWITAITGNSLTLSQNATVPATTTLTPYNSVTNQTTASINTLNLSGVGASFTLAASQTLSVNGILRSGNNSGVVGAISGGTAIQPATSGGELVIRTDAVNDTLNISSIIQNNASASSLTKTGAGTLILEDLASNANNTYSGGTFINAGTVQLGAGNAGSGSRTWFGPAGSLVTMADGAAITSVNDPAKTIANTIYLSSGFPSVTTRDIILNGTISGPGGLAIISFNGRGVTLPVANSFTGGVKLQAGGGSGGEVRLSTTASAGAFGTGTLRVESANGPVLMGNATLNGGSGVPNPIDLAPGATFTVTPSGASFPVLLSGTISGLGALSKSGVGSLTLSGANTYSGGTTVSYGLLTVSGSGTFGSSAGNLTASGGILDLNAASWNAGLVTISGGTIQNGTLTATTSPYTASKGFVFANLAGGSIGLTMNGSGNRLVLSGNNTYGGTTTITAGTLQPTSAAALPNYASGPISVGANGILRIVAGTWSQAEISALLANPNLTFTSGGALAIDTTGGGLADSTVLDPANMGLTKLGANTLTLSGTSTYSGKTTVTAGTIMLDAGSGGALSSSSALTFGGTGTFNYDNTTSTVSKAQSMGALTFSTGEGTLRLTRTSLQPVSLTFTSLAARGTGATRNFVIDGTPGVNGTDSKITLTGRVAGFIDQGTFFNGSTYAWMNGLSPSYVRGLNYDGSEGVTSGATATLGSATHQQITGAISAQNTATFTTLNISGNNNVTLAAAQTVSVNGILKTGNVAGGATISGGTGIQAVSSGGEMVIRTDGTNDALTINTTILANGTSSLIKSGAGTLTLAASNSITGGIVLNAGKLVINHPQALGPKSKLTINEGTVLDNTSGGDISLPKNDGGNFTINGSFTYIGTSGDLSVPDDAQQQNLNNDVTITVVGTNRTLKITYASVRQPTASPRKGPAR